MLQDSYEMSSKFPGHHCNYANNTMLYNVMSLILVKNVHFNNSMSEYIPSMV